MPIGPRDFVPETVGPEAPEEARLPAERFDPFVRTLGQLAEMGMLPPGFAGGRAERSVFDVQRTPGSTVFQAAPSNPMFPADALSSAFDALAQVERISSVFRYDRSQGGVDPRQVARYLPRDETEPGGFLGMLQWLGIFNFAIAGWANAWIDIFQGEKSFGLFSDEDTINPYYEAWKGLTKQEIETFEDVFKNLGWDAGEGTKSATARWWVGLAADIVLDPLNLISIGPKGVALLGRSGRFWARVPVAFERAGRLKPLAAVEKVASDIETLGGVGRKLFAEAGQYGAMGDHTRDLVERLAAIENRARERVTTAARKAAGEIEGDALDNVVRASQELTDASMAALAHAEVLDETHVTLGRLLGTRTPGELEEVARNADGDIGRFFRLLGEGPFGEEAVRGLMEMDNLPWTVDSIIRYLTEGHRKLFDPGGLKLHIPFTHQELSLARSAMADRVSLGINAGIAKVIKTSGKAFDTLLPADKDIARKLARGTITLPFKVLGSGAKLAKKGLEASLRLLGIDRNKDLLFKELNRQTQAELHIADVESRTVAESLITYGEKKEVLPKDVQDEMFTFLMDEQDRAIEHLRSGNAFMDYSRHVVGEQGRDPNQLHVLMDYLEEHKLGETLSPSDTSVLRQRIVGLGYSEEMADIAVERAEAANKLFRALYDVMASEGLDVPFLARYMPTQYKGFGRNADIRLRPKKGFEKASTKDVFTKRRLLTREDAKSLGLEMIDSLPVLIAERLFAAQRARVERRLLERVFHLYGLSENQMGDVLVQMYGPRDDMRRMLLAIVRKDTEELQTFAEAFRPGHETSLKLFEQWMNEGNFSNAAKLFFEGLPEGSKDFTGTPLAEALPPLVGVIPRRGLPGFDDEEFMTWLKNGAILYMERARNTIDDALLNFSVLDLRTAAYELPDRYPVLKEFISRGDLGAGWLDSPESAPVLVYGLMVHLRRSREVKMPIQSLSISSGARGVDSGISGLAKLVKQSSLDAARLRVLEYSYESAARRRLDQLVREPGHRNTVARTSGMSADDYEKAVKDKVEELISEGRVLEVIDDFPPLDAEQRSQWSAKGLAADLETWLDDQIPDVTSAEGAMMGPPHVMALLHDEYAQYLPMLMFESQSWQAPRFVSSNATREFFELANHSRQLHEMWGTARKAELDLLSKKYGVEFGTLAEFDAFIFAHYGTHPALHRAHVEFLAKHGYPPRYDAQSFGEMSREGRKEMLVRASHIAADMEQQGLEVPDVIKTLENVWAPANPAHAADSESARRVLEKVAKEFSEGDEIVEKELLALLLTEPNHRPDVHFSAHDGITSIVLMREYQRVNKTFTRIAGSVKRSEPRIAAASKRSGLVSKKLGTAFPSGANPLLFNSTVGGIVRESAEQMDGIVRDLMQQSGIEPSMPERAVADFVGDLGRLLTSRNATDVSDTSIDITRTVTKFWDSVKHVVNHLDEGVGLASSLMDTQRALVDLAGRARELRDRIADVRRGVEEVVSHPENILKLEAERSDELIERIDKLREELEKWDKVLRSRVEVLRGSVIDETEARVLGLEHVAKTDPVLAGIYELRQLVRDLRKTSGPAAARVKLEGIERELAASAELDAVRVAESSKRLLKAMDTLHELDDVASSLSLAQENVLRPSLRVLDDAGLLEDGADLSVLSTSPRLMRAAIGVEAVDRFLAGGDISRRGWRLAVLRVVDDLSESAARAGVPMDLDYQRSLMAVIDDFLSIESIPPLERPFEGSIPLSKLEWLVANSHAGKWRLQTFEGELPARAVTARLRSWDEDMWANLWGGTPPQSLERFLERVDEVRGELARPLRRDNAWFHEFAERVGLRGPRGDKDLTAAWRALGADAIEMRALKRALLESAYAQVDLAPQIMSEFLDSFEGMAVPPAELLRGLFDDGGLPLPGLSDDMLLWVVNNAPVAPGEEVSTEAIQRAWAIAVDNAERNVAEYPVVVRVTQSIEAGWEEILGRLPYTPGELEVERAGVSATVMDALREMKMPLVDGMRANILSREHAEALIEFLQAMDPVAEIQDVAGGAVRNVEQLLGRAEPAFKVMSTANVMRFKALAELLLLSEREGINPRLTNLVGLDSFVQKAQRRTRDGAVSIDATVRAARKRAVEQATDIVKSSWFRKAVDADRVSDLEMQVARDLVHPSLLAKAKTLAKYGDKAVKVSAKAWGNFLGTMVAKMEHDVLVDLMKRLPSRADVRLLSVASLPVDEAQLELMEAELRRLDPGAATPGKPVTTSLGEEGDALPRPPIESSTIIADTPGLAEEHDLLKLDVALRRDMAAAMERGKIAALPSSIETLHDFGIGAAQMGDRKTFLVALREVGFDVNEEMQTLPVRLTRIGYEVPVSQEVAIRDGFEWIETAHAPRSSLMFMPATEVQVATIRKLLNTLAPEDVASQQWILYALTSTMDVTQLRAMEAAYVIENIQDYAFAHKFSETGRPVGAEGLGLRPHVEAETAAVLGRLPSDVAERVLSAEKSLAAEGGLDALEEMKVVRAPFVFNLRDIYGRVINPGGEGIRLPRWVARMFEEDVMKPQVLNSPVLRWLLSKFYDPMLNAYKELQTVIHPSFVWRNFIDTGVRVSFGMGLWMRHPRRVREAWNLMHGKPGSVVIRGMGEVPNEVLYEMAERNGLIVDFRDILGETGHRLPSADDLPEDYFDYLNENWAWKKFQGVRDGIGHISGDVDNVGRLMLFLYGLDEGMSPSMATQWAQKFMFDYAHGLTPFERQFMRRVFPFYTFARFNIPLSFEMMLRHPGPVSALGKTQHMLTQDEPGWEEALPPYIREAWHVVVARDGNTLKVLNGRNMISLEDLGFLGSLDWVSGGFAAGTMEELIGRMSPFIKIWPEFVAGRNFYMQKDILEDQTIRRALPQVPLLNDWLEARPVKIGDNIYTRVNGFRWHLLQQTHLSRIYRSLSHLLGPGEDTTFERFLPFVTGLRLTSVDLERRYSRLVQVSNMYRGRIRLALEQGDIEQAQRLAYSGERPPQRDQKILDTIRQLQDLQAADLQNAFR